MEGMCRSFFAVDANSLEGTIPESYGQLSSLVYLMVFTLKLCVKLARNPERDAKLLCVQCGCWSRSGTISY